MPGSETRFTILFFTDIVGSTDLKTRFGVPAYRQALEIHNAHFERIAHECRGIRILQNMGDGYFAEGESVVEVVKFALLFQQAMRAGPWGEIVLATRVGIHAGEVSALEVEGGSGLLAPAADLAARVMSLALGGQILLTRFPFDETRHFLREHPATAGQTAPPLRWLAHGPYLLKGREEPMEIFEVGADGLAPLVAPPDSEKATRAIRPGEEETLGWRPAVGLEIPGRPGWQLVELLGKGGFGEVWAGEHPKLRQRRAFKFCFDDERLRALKRELTLVRLLRSALGERDDILRIHDLRLDAPPFYLESDLAPQGNLLQWAEQQGGLAQIPLAQRIALVAHTASALAAAHSLGVLHKDLKPTNILIFDGPGGEPRPRLVDFGIGTLADPAVLGQHGISGAGFTRLTIEHSTGTPTYSPPEYLAGKPFTTQGDIYGLGVLLYQLVTARPLEPLAHGWEREITNPLLREDIAACVEGDPARRLSSAAELAARLLHLDERRAEQVEKERLAREATALAEAEAATAAARLRARRLRTLATAFALLALLAITGGGLAWRNEQKAASALSAVEAALGEVEEKKAEVDRKAVEYRALLAEAARSDRLVADEKLRGGREREAFAYFARACRYDPNSTLAAEMAVVALNMWRFPVPATILGWPGEHIWTAEFSPNGSRIVTTSQDGVRVWEAATGKHLTRVGPAGKQHYLTFSPDGRRLFSASHDKTARVWDTGSWMVLATLEGHATEWISAKLSPDGSHIVVADAKDKIPRVWNAETGQIFATFAGQVEHLRDAHFSPDGSRIVDTSWNRDHTAQVWDATTGKLLVTLAGHEDNLGKARFSPDGSRIVTTSNDKTARVWNAETGQMLATLAGHEDNVWSAEFSPDGSRIVTASWDHTPRVWDAATGKLLATLPGHEDRVPSAEFSPDGSRIVTASWDKTARVWDAGTGQMLAILAGHEGNLRRAQFNRDGSLIVTVSLDRTARVWEVPAGRDLPTVVGGPREVRRAEFSPDGRSVVIVGDDNSPWVCDSGTGRRLLALKGHDRPVTGAEFSPDGSRIVSSSIEKTALVWDARTGKILAALTGHQGAVHGARFNPDGTRIVASSDGKTALVWDAKTGQLLLTLAGHLENVWSAEFSPSGTRIATASHDHTAKVWQATTGQLLLTLSGHEQTVTSAHISPDEERIVTASWDHTARLWDAENGRPLAILRGHTAYVESAQFSPDGARIVTASSDGTVRVWDGTSGKPLDTLGGKAPIARAEFSHDSSRVVTANNSLGAKVWDVGSGKLVAMLAVPGKGVQRAQFSRDGSRILTELHDSSALVWSVLPPTAGPTPEWFPDFLQYMAQMRLNTDGELETLKPDAWLALREKLREIRRAAEGQETPYLQILRRHLR